MADPFRQFSLHRPLRAKAFTAAGPIDFPAEFPGGVTFKMTLGTLTITGAATGDALGNLTYQWQAGNLDVVGTYDAVFIGTDGTGKFEQIPTEASVAEPNLQVRVIAAL